jgi:hypothetical protein
MKVQVPEVRASCNKCDWLGLEEEERIPERGIFSKLREDGEMMLYHLPVYIYSKISRVIRIISQY